MSLPTEKELAKMTPMMVQYFELKRKAQDAILFFRMGDFYEIFGDDAEEVAPKLEIIMTSREKGSAERIPFCGVPHHSARNYWLKLLKMGYKVAIADQVESPKEAKGLVKREIIRVITPGCIDDLEGLDNDSPNYLMALFEEPTKNRWVVSVSDISTGELRVANFNNEKELIALVEKLKPREVIARRFYLNELQELLKDYLFRERISFGELPEAVLRDKSSQKSIIKRVFGKNSIESQPCGEVEGGVPLVAALITYLEGLYVSCQQFSNIKPLQDPDTMQFDEIATRDLEIFETVRRRTGEGSLYREINCTLSPMGARYLRYCLANPLIDGEKIKARQQGVQTLMDMDGELFQDLRKELQNMPDLERLTTRVLSGGAHPLEVAKIRSTLEKVDMISNLFSQIELEEDGLLAHISSLMKNYRAPLELLQKAILASPGTLSGKLDVFQEGYDSAFDERRGLARNGEGEIANYESELREQTSIGNLRIKNHKTFGLLIEVTKSNLAKVPSSFIRRQTMVNCERFVTVELQDFHEALVSAQEEAVAREDELYKDLLLKLGAFKECFKQIAFGLAILDLLQSFTCKAKDYDYCRPKLSSNGEVKLVASRHPVVEKFVGRHEFVPNDILLEGKTKHLFITGPNMAGKSTAMRQTAICALLHQIGSYIPAHEAILPIFDRIFTRVGASDDLARGQSTFMVEMSEASHILRNASKHSLVILDEVGRGTSTQDGMALASAILEELVQTVGCYSLFATHYHELIPMAKKFPKVKLVQTQVREVGNDIAFTHRLIEGASGSSFGLEVAKIAGLPSRVLQRAKIFLDEHQVQSKNIKKEKVVEESSFPMENMGLHHSSPSAVESSVEPEIINKLKKLNIHRTTPLQALNILNDLKTMHDQGEQQGLFPDY